jgi:hypothetical protein
MPTYFGTDTSEETDEQTFQRVQSPLALQDMLMRLHNETLSNHKNLKPQSRRHSQYLPRTSIRRIAYMGSSRAKANTPNMDHTTTNTMLE